METVQKPEEGEHLALKATTSNGNEDVTVDTSSV
jgi:hypothetical protein